MDTFEILRAALFESARAALEADTLPGVMQDPEYQAEMHRTLDAIRAAEDCASLAAIDWVQGLAEMGRDTSRYDIEIPNL